MTRRTPLTDDQQNIYDRVVEVVNFASWGHRPAKIAEWLGIDLAEVESILADPRAYQKAHGITPRAVCLGAKVPTPAEIERCQAACLRAKLAHKLAETSTHFDYDRDYQRPKIRGY